jgi:hypothetical protein
MARIVAILMNGGQGSSLVRGSTPMFMNESLMAQAVRDRIAPGWHVRPVIA